jgi:hypothetical protein
VSGASERGESSCRSFKSSKSRRACDRRDETRDSLRDSVTHSRPRLLAMRARSARNTFLTLRCFVCSSTPLAASVASGGALPAGTGGKKSKPARCCTSGLS